MLDGGGWSDTDLATPTGTPGWIWSAQYCPRDVRYENGGADFQAKGAAHDGWMGV